MRCIKISKEKDAILRKTVNVELRKGVAGGARLGFLCLSPGRREKMLVLRGPAQPGQQGGALSWGYRDLSLHPM